MESPCCQDCRYCWQDDRSSVYRRPPFFFCRRKGSFFSRNYQIGEGTRIDPCQSAPASNFLLNKPIADKKEEPHLKWCGSSFYDGFIYRSACWLCSSFGIAFAIRNPASAVKPTSGSRKKRL